ncbi:hypothetical protein CSAL01_13750, partial [Colletotrichum salicis]
PAPNSNRSRPQPPPDKPPPHTLRDPTRRIQHPAPPPNMRSGTDQPARRDKVQRPDEVRVRRSERGGDGAAEGVAQQVEGVVAGPAWRGGRGEREEDLGGVEAGVVGEVEGRVGVAATEEVWVVVHYPPPPLHKLPSNSPQRKTRRPNPMQQENPLLRLLRSKLIHPQIPVRRRNVPRAGEHVGRVRQLRPLVVTAPAQRRPFRRAGCLAAVPGRTRGREGGGAGAARDEDEERGGGGGSRCC